ncbi:hypothetical protein FH608_008115 [Nonomuraea phyllanthi]|uniref:Uncharacterized protein n=1 Tax=Nonomuraea phyllanthi TaxID=2219224 RepID=A0A5C4WSV1_9ACTN|nr:hypothetical protein [Nonomuraea phyllanthi]KAB8196664.1 hypothetical protein FH608_008115 [Nonomuraea phyllanthi]QFY13597.1 hypothetical protein GBF35_49835 [Nonomuraea phyllanthi]
MIVSRRGLAAAVVTLAGLALAGVTFLAGRQPSSQLYDELAAQVTLALEQSSPAEHHAHGHEFESRVVCAVEPFGIDPPDATSVVEVKWVYARHMCAITGEGTDWKTSVRASGPIAVRLGIPPVIKVPEPGVGYPDRVRKLIPARYHEQAFAGFEDEDAIDAARQRFAQATRSQSK